MNENGSVENPNQSQRVVHLHCTMDNLFIPGLAIFSLAVFAGLIIRPINNSVL